MGAKHNISVTADVIIFGKEDGKVKYLLLVQRRNEPFKGKWAFPGGFVEDNEDLPVAASRELEEETGLRVESKCLNQLGAWGTPDRDPRGRTVTIAFTADVNVNEQEIKAADDAADARWWPVIDFPDLAFDHEQILKAAMLRKIIPPNQPSKP